MNKLSDKDFKKLSPKQIRKGVWVYPQIVDGEQRWIGYSARAFGLRNRKGKVLFTNKPGLGSAYGSPAR